MSKAFVPTDRVDEDPDEVVLPALPAGVKNYVTPSGHKRLQQELNRLVRVERPDVVKIVSWAAGNGDRSENGDYIYGKRRLREIDRRIRFLSKRLENAEVVDPASREDCDRVYFGATVNVVDAEGAEHVYSIVGIDEADPGRGWISWVSPLARALLKAELGDCIRLQTPGGVRELEVVEIRYLALE